MNFITKFLITVPIFFIIDLLWLGVIAKNIYNQNLEHLISKNVNWPAAIIFYFIYIFGIVYFVIQPGGSLLEIAKRGALFGFIAYATYDLTNLATLKDWPINITIIDLIWGTVLTATVATISTLIFNKFL